jgi:hypothetical protein
MQETGSRSGRATKHGLPFSPKDRIGHASFGLGTVLEIDERRTTIEFDEAGVRKFVTSMVKLVASDTTAPPKPARTRKKVARSK